ncbi:MAG: hypothetical protein R2712_08310 [Vicinamibacterales bacterium]
MAEPPATQAASGPAVPDRGTRLDSWKEIAAYLQRDVRTLQRWEKTAGLPVRRLQKPGLRAVYAYTADLDAWMRDRDPAATDAADEGAEAAARAPDPPAAAAAPRSIRWLPYAAAAAVLVVTASFALRPRGPAALGPFTARPITSEPGNERDPDISPDGKYVAYAQQAPDLATRIVVRLIDGGEPHDITAGTRDEWSPAWSPDGARIAFLRGDPADTADLMLTTPLGGAERTVATVRPYARRRLLLIGHLLAWTPDGRHIVVPDQATAGEGSLFLVDAETGARQRLTTPGDAHFDLEPSLSADGRLLVFNRVRGEYRSDVFVQRLDAAYRPVGPPTKLPAAGSWNGTPRVLDDRGEVLVSAGPCRGCRCGTSRWMARALPCRSASSATTRRSRRWTAPPAGSSRARSGASPTCCASPARGTRARPRGPAGGGVCPVHLHRPRPRVLARRLAGGLHQRSQRLAAALGGRRERGESGRVDPEVRGGHADAGVVTRRVAHRLCGHRAGRQLSALRRRPRVARRGAREHRHPRLRAACLVARRAVATPPRRTGASTRSIGCRSPAGRASRCCPATSTSSTSLRTATDSTSCGARNGRARNWTSCPCRQVRPSISPP